MRTFVTLNLRLDRELCLRLLLLAILLPVAGAQQTYTWEKLREKFRITNPTPQAGQLNIDESRAQEITAYLRPNPDFTLSLDQFAPLIFDPVWRPLGPLLTT